MAQPDISKGVDLTPITTQSSPYCCSTRRITFSKLTVENRSKIDPNKSVPNKWYISSPQK